MTLDEAAVVKEASETICDVIQYMNDVMHQRFVVSYDVCIYRHCLLSLLYSSLLVALPQAAAYMLHSVCMFVHLSRACASGKVGELRTSWKVQELKTSGKVRELRTSGGKSGNFVGVQRKIA